MKTLLLLTLLLVAPLAQAQPPHPLEGHIWAVESATFVSQEALFDHLPNGGWLILGEQHDHPEHHRIQTDWINALADRGRLGAVALEMADANQQPLLDQALGKGKTISAEALNWQPGWPWSLYGEVVTTALDRATAVVATDLPREAQRLAYREGAPEGDLGDAHADFMRELLYDSHCGQLPHSALDGMRQLQLARDQQMAKVLQQYADPTRTGVMLTGNIHARRDLGIPRWLERPMISVLMIPADGSENPVDYMPDGLPDQPVADYLLFTSTLADKDYCAEFEARKD